MKLQKIKLKDLVNFQGDIKSITQQKRDELIKNIKTGKEETVYQVCKVKDKFFILDGNHRVDILKEIKGEDYELEVNLYDGEFTEKTAMEKLIKINEQKAKFEKDALEIKMEFFGIDHHKFEDLMFQPMDEIEQLEDEVVEDVPPAIPETPITVKGDLYEFISEGATHRVYCADTTDIKAMGTLMDGKEADLVFTDPPYNVDISNAEGKKIDNDNMSGEDFSQFLKDCFTNMFLSTKKGGCAYIFHADSERENFTREFTNSGFLFKQCLVWVKTQSSLSRQDYNWKHEPILYGWRDGPHYFCNDFTNTTALEEDTKDLTKLSKSKLVNIIKNLAQKKPETIVHELKPTVSKEHPTMKPVRLCAKLIKNSSRINETILDPFGGSGSTLIACQQLKRNCYIMEYGENYCDVIVKRYINYMNDKDKKFTIKRNGGDVDVSIFSDNE